MEISKRAPHSYKFGIMHEVILYDERDFDTRLCKRNKFAWYFVYLPPLGRIDSAYRFPYALCLQTLELHLNIIEALYNGPEFLGQVNIHNIIGGNGYSSF